MTSIFGMNCNLKTILSSALLAAGALLQSTSHAAEPISIRVDEGAFPATYVRKDHWEGMDIEILQEVMTRAQLDYQFVERPFPRSLIEMREGTVHVIPNLVKNEARSVYMHWLGPTRITCIGLVVKEKDKELPISSTDELIRIARERDQKIGYLNGASYSPYLDKRLENDPNLQDVLYMLPDNDRHRAMLKFERIVGYFFDAFEIQQRLSDEDFASDYQGLALNINYRIEDSCTGAYIGISQKLDPKRLEAIRRAYQAMQDDGTFSAIHVKWLGKDPDF